MKKAQIFTRISIQKAYITWGYYYTGHFIKGKIWHNLCGYMHAQYAKRLSHLKLVLYEKGYYMPQVVSFRKLARKATVKLSL